MNKNIDEYGFNQPALYADRLITIRPEAITFRWYYFWGSKTVPLDVIKSVESLEPTVLNGKWRIWGSSSPGGWMPLDWNRPSRDRIFLLHHKNKNFQIGFTAENSFLAENAFRQVGLLKTA